MAEKSRLRHSHYVWIILSLFIGLGLGYSTLTPIFENSDETLHYPYVKHLADGQGLPVAEPDRPWNQEGTQPPLYYALVAASTFWIDTGNLPEHLQQNPHWLFTQVRTLINDNQNRVLHGPMDAFPYRRTALAVHIGRWWSLFFGVVTVAATYKIAQHFFPTNLPLILTATAVAAFTPQFLRVSTTVSNDSLSAALASLTVLAALKFTTQPRPAGAPFVPPLILGVLSGLALLTKLSSLTALLLAAVIVVWQMALVRKQPLRMVLLWLGMMGATAALLSGWWFLRNVALYGEWLATETHLDLAGRGDLSPAAIWSLRAEIERAYWATFGWGQIRLPEWLYLVLGWLTRLGLIGLGLGLAAKLVMKKRAQRALFLNLEHLNIPVIAFLAFWVILNLILYVRWVMEVGSVSHTRLIFPAITAISLLLAGGWHTLIPRRVGGWFSGLLTLSLVALNLYSLGWLIDPAFTPNRSPLAAGEAIELTFLDSMQLKSGSVTVHPHTDLARRKEAAVQGDTVAINLTWQVQQQMDHNYSVGAVLLAPDGQVLARRETYPGLGLHPTRYLQPGQTFSDVYPLTLIEPVTEPLVARAIVSLFDFQSDARAGFPAIDALGQAVTPVVGLVKVIPAQWPEYRPSQTVYVNFANAIALIGYDLTPQLTLYWQSLAPVDEDYHLFIHLLDRDGNQVAQADAPPTHKVYPTGWWAPGETIAGVHPLPDAPTAARLRLGFYSLASGSRLPIIESTLPTEHDGVEIALPTTRDQ